MAWDGELTEAFDRLFPGVSEVPGGWMIRRLNPDLFLAGNFGSIEAHLTQPNGPLTELRAELAEMIVEAVVGQPECDMGRVTVLADVVRMIDARMEER